MCRVEDDLFPAVTSIILTYVALAKTAVDYVEWASLEASSGMFSLLAQRPRHLRGLVKDGILM